MATNTKHLVIEEQRCKSCGLCVARCPKQTLEIGTRLNRQGYEVVEQVRPDACIYCDLCRLVCPDVAIGVVAD
jgi:2-oxoglutarate ferredoxin oxidoreductase subunit delta